MRIKISVCKNNQSGHANNNCCNNIVIEASGCGLIIMGVALWVWHMSLKLLSKFF